MSTGKKLIPLVVFLSLGCGVEPGAEATAASAEAEACSSRRPPAVIFDTDMDFDDSAALAYLCAEHLRGNIELRAVTIENDGAGIPGSTIRHARCVLAACGLPDVPVADGAATGMHPVSPQLQGAVEAVLQGAFADCTEPTTPSSESAVSLLRRSLHGHDTTLIATGPVTNVAAAISGRQGRGIGEDVENVVLMTGAFDVGGNLLGIGTEGFDDTQEVNAWADPTALQTVLDRFEHRVTIVPLDATEDVPVTFAYAAQIAGDAQTASADVVVDITSQPIVQFGISIHAFFWWDPLAAVAAVSASGHSDVISTERDRVAVITAEGPSSGRTYFDRHGAHVSVAHHASAAIFEQAFLDGLNERD